MSEMRQSPELVWYRRGTLTKDSRYSIQSVSSQSQKKGLDPKHVEGDSGRGAGGGGIYGLLG